MVKKLFVGAILVIVACAAYGKAQGGPIADALYSNSMYGMSHPLTNGFPSPVEYALTIGAIGKKQSRDADFGVAFNLLVPGLGSAIIGDPHAPAIFFGYIGSLATGFAGALATILSGITYSSSRSLSLSTYQVVTIGITWLGIGSAIGFYIWGIFSPINYVTSEQYLKRIQQ